MRKYYKYLIGLLVVLFLLLSLFKDNVNTYLNPNILSAHFIDVGQGDAILLTVNNKVLLIDSGPKASGNELFNYIDSLGIKTLDYVIASHPHEDHIGNMSSIISKYNVKNFYAPKATSNSKSFEKMVQSLNSRNLKINSIIKKATEIDLGSNCQLTVLSSIVSGYEDNLNLSSPIIKIKYKDISYIFTGDAEISNEQEALKDKDLLNANILKLGHHGSNTSTSEAFYNAVSPSIAVISVGKDNSYNHPNREILSFLFKKNNTLFRTDEDGTIVISTDGNKIYTYFPDK